MHIWLSFLLYRFTDRAASHNIVNVTVSAVNATMLNYKKKIDDLRQKTKELSDQCCQEKKENEQLREIKSTLSNQIVELNQKRDSHEQTISNSITEKENLQKSMDLLSKEKHSLIQTNANSKSTVSLYNF